MSLINSRQVLCIALAPQQVSFALRSGNNFIAPSAWHQAIDNPEGQWQNALALLQTGLQQAQDLPSGCAVEISIASRWCQMLRMPWSDALLSPASAQRFLQNQYVALFGEAAREWQITLDDAPYAAPRLACALDSTLLAALNEVAQAYQFTLQAIEPLLSVAWRAAQKLHKKAQAFVLVEADRLTLAQLQHGRIVEAHSQYWKPGGAAQNHTWEMVLQQAWQRACLREPQFAELSQVSVLNVSGHPHRGELPTPFQLLQLHNPELAPSYAALVCQR